MRKFYLILATVLSFVLLNEISIRPQNGNYSEWLTQEASVAYARSRGGRSRGGSFSRPSRSSPSRSSPSRSSPSRSSPSRSSGSSSSSSPSRSSGSSSGSTVQDSVRPSSSPSTGTSNSTSNTSTNTSNGQTGGRSRAGSFNKPTVTPAPVTPNNTTNNNSTSNSVPVSPSTGTSTGTTYVPVVPPSGYGHNSHGSGHRSFELEIENNTIIVPPSQPAPQPYIAPVPTDTENLANPTETEQPVTSPNSTLQPVPVNAAPTKAAPNTTVAPSNSAQSKGFPWGWVLFFLVIGGGIAIAWYVLASKNSTAGTANELDNDVVTVTKLQIALLANARDLQSDLTEMSDRADFDSPEGRVEFLQEAALALLRQPEYWSHALSSSETVKSREQAGQVFEQLSIAERSKFSAETFSNVQGQVREREGISGGDDDDPAAYIVVTLLIGTEDDRPLFGSIHSTEELQQALQRVAAITTDYLLVVELLWTPQQDTDSLSYDQLLTGYADMVQL